MAASSALSCRPRSSSTPPRGCGDDGAARPARRAVELGLAPIAAGLVLAGGFAVLRVAPGRAAVAAAAIAATAILLRWPRLHPLSLFGAAAQLFGIAAALGW